MNIELAPLPYARDALAPVISSATIDLHYGKHHKGYVDALNGLIREAPYQSMGLADIVRAAKADGADKIFNNAGQAWNHDLYWRSLSPKRSSPGGAFAAAIASAFGSRETLETKLVETGVQRFGSGWVWLVVDGDRLDVVSTSNAESPMVEGRTCLLTLDVWEHAYYVDYQNRRADHLKAVVGLIDWAGAGGRFAEHTA